MTPAPCRTSTWDRDVPVWGLCVAGPAPPYSPSQSPPPRRVDRTLGAQAEIGARADLTFCGGELRCPASWPGCPRPRKAQGFVSGLGPRAQVARRTRDVGTRALTAYVARGAHPQGAEVLEQDFRWLSPRRFFTWSPRTLNCIQQVCSFFGRGRNLLEKLQRI